MTAQLSLYDFQTIGAPHNSTDTSIEAARLAGPKAGTQKWNILTHIAYQGPKTEDELELELGMLRSAVCARCNELVKDGRLRDSGERRKTRYGVAAIVWELVPAVAS